MLLKDKVAIVTGAARGIGEATARELNQKGARVVLCDIDPLVEEIATSIQEDGVQAIPLTYDISRPTDAKSLVEHTVREFGRVDILVNNAAICPRIPIEEMTEEAFDQIIDVNLKAVFFLSRAAAEVMKIRQWGRIVNLASTAARVGGMVNATVYGASKAGVLALSKSLARHYAPYNIGVNVVAPGAVDTRLMTMTDEERAVFIERVPLGRMASPAEVAQVIVFLCSNKVSFMTGATVDVNGGILMV